MKEKKTPTIYLFSVPSHLYGRTGKCEPAVRGGRERESGDIAGGREEERESQKEVVKHSIW